MYSKQCDQCGDPFVATVSNRRRCSLECDRAARRALDAKRKPYSAERICERPDCRSAYTATFPQSRFCCRSCAATVNNRRYPKRVRREASPCPACGESIKSPQNRYCDRRCYLVAKRGRAHLVDWIEGRTSASGGTGGLLDSARQYLIEEAGEKCTQCGWCTPNPKLGRPILTVDHIDGDWRNNLKSNLRVLCYNCHTLTETFCRLNDKSPGGMRFYISPKLILRAQELAVADTEAA